MKSKTRYFDGGGWNLTWDSTLILEACLRAVEKRFFLVEISFFLVEILHFLVENIMVIWGSSRFGFFSSRFMFFSSRLMFASSRSRRGICVFHRSVLSVLGFIAVIVCSVGAASDANG